MQLTDFSNWIVCTMMSFLMATSVFSQNCRNSVTILLLVIKDS